MTRKILLNLTKLLTSVLTSNIYNSRKMSDIFDLDFVAPIKQAPVPIIQPIPISAQKTEIPDDKRHAEIPFDTQYFSHRRHKYSIDFNTISSNNNNTPFVMNYGGLQINNIVINNNNNINYNQINGETLNPFSKNVNDKNYGYDLDVKNEKKFFTVLRNIQRQQQQNQTSNKKSKEVYDKNICRYIARQIIRSFVHDQFEKHVLNLCEDNEELYIKTTNYLLKNIESISGHRALRDFILPYEEDESEIVQQKQIFRKFCK